MGKVAGVAIALSVEGVLSSEMWQFLEGAYREMRRVRTADGVSDSFVAWSEGFVRGAVEVVALGAGLTQDELLGWLQRRFVEWNEAGLIELTDR